MATNTYSLSLSLASSQYAGIDGAAQTGLGITGDLTLIGFMNLSTLPGAGQQRVLAIMKDFGATGRVTYQFFVNNTGGVYSLRLYHQNSSDLNDNVGVAWTPSTATWYLACVTVSGSSVNFYVDASQVGATQTLSNTRQHNSNSDFALGRSGGAANDYMDGLMDEWGVYGAILSTTQQSNILSGYDQRDVASSSGYWQLNNGYTDLSGNSNTLTGSGSPTFSATVPFATYISLTGASFFLNLI